MSSVRDALILLIWLGIAAAFAAKAGAWPVVVCAGIVAVCQVVTTACDSQRVNP